MSEISDSDFSTPEAAETAFYTAFADCDVKAMNTIWASANVICIHPGSSALVGREAVMRSWSNMLSNAELPNIRVNVLSRLTEGGLAVHVVEEHITSGYGESATASMVLATNVYRREEGVWRLLEHHASVPRFQKRGMSADKPSQHTLQ